METLPQIPAQGGGKERWVFKAKQIILNTGVGPENTPQCDRKCTCTPNFLIIFSCESTTLPPRSN